MKITESIGFLCEFSEDEAAKIREIADRDGITLEEALAQAIKNFLAAGVQTPKNALLSGAA